jgi:2-oxoglutarate ferredoxin oxidoreductase subunit gamma
MEVQRYEILLSGSGGQGIILAGLIIAETGIRQNLQVVQTASYGPESRGGASRSEVVLSGTKIDYPAVTEPDFVITLTQEAADKYASEVRPGGIVLFDTTWVEKIPQGIHGRVSAFPLTEEASVRFGKALVANVIALGFFAELNPLVTADMLHEVLMEKVPKHYREMNEAAFTFGRELAKKEP